MVAEPVPGLPKRRLWTRQQYYRMAELGLFAPDERVELIEGEIVEMAPQGPEHASTADALRDRLAAAFGPGYCIRSHAPLALGQASDPEPDVAVVLGSHRDYAHAHPTTAILVVEVSQSTLVFDRGTKAALYAAARIPEYWIVNVERSLLEVHRDPQADPSAPLGASYASVMRLGRAATVTPLAAPRAVLRVDDLLPPA
ncbi:MAG: Uma2 family endonuclease [Armatimonadetes bacterium]|nr:Uma2 family endonuclease [Armatimonadota bacterium]